MKLTMYKGTTLNLIITPMNEDGSTITLSEGDKVMLTVKAFRPPGEPELLLSRTLTAADYDINSQLAVCIEPAETADISPGNYTYDCGIEFADGSFYIFIQPDIFEIRSCCSEKSEQQEVIVGGDTQP